MRENSVLYHEELLKKMRSLLVSFKKNIDPKLPKDIQTLIIINLLIEHSRKDKVANIKDVLIFAIVIQKLDWVKIILREYKDIDINFEYQKNEGKPIKDYPLYLAITTGNLDMVLELVKYGANPMRGDHFKTLCSYGYKDLLKYFLKMDLSLETLREGFISSIYQRKKTFLDMILSKANYNPYIYKGILRHAVMMGYMDMIKYLLYIGDDINYDNDIALKRSLMRSDIGLIRFLISKGANTDSIGKDDIYHRIRSFNMRRRDIIKFLVEEANVNIFNMDVVPGNFLNKAIPSIKTDILQYLLHIGISDWMVVGNGLKKCFSVQYSEMAKILLNYPYILNLDERITLLEKVAKEGNLDLLKYMIDRGFDYRRLKIDRYSPKIKDYIEEEASKKYNASDYQLCDIMKIPYSKGIEKKLNQLIEKVDINTMHGYALRKAVVNGNLEMVKYLIEKGADIHVMNELPIRLARDKEILEYLIQKGVDIHFDDEYLLRSNIVNGDTEMVRILVKNGAVLPAGYDYLIRAIRLNGYEEIHEMVLGYLYPKNF